MPINTMLQSALRKVKKLHRKIAPSKKKSQVPTRKVAVFVQTDAPERRVSMEVAQELEQPRQIENKQKLSIRQRLMSITEESQIPLAIQEELLESAENQKKTQLLPTIDELRRAIPPRCFEKDTLHSFAYLLFDYVMLAAMYFSVSYFESYGGRIGLLIWWWLMGMVYTAFFMIGHDAGHGSFSESEFWSSIGGHLAMSPILTPFWPMGKSHRQHHNFTAHLQKDKGYFWTKEEDYHEQGFLAKHWSKLPISNFIKWNPLHVFFGVPDGSLYWPYSKLFKTDFERLQCVVSSSACFFCVFVALKLCDYSLYDFAKYYYIPILFHGFWMVMLTTLQHQDDETEVYEQGKWTFVMGQTQTIDRVYGLGIDWILHHVTDCHVVHHFFNKIPHYRLKEATEAMNEVMKWYPGVYKRRPCYFHLFEFLRLNFVLEYLFTTEAGVRKFNASAEYNPKLVYLSKGRRSSCLCNTSLPASH